MNSTIFFFIFIPILSIILLSVNFILATHKPYKEKKTPFECGYHSFLAQNRTQFTISFFIFALLFLIFDLEIVLIYPITVSSYFNTIYGIIVVILFVLILTLGFVFELGKRALTIYTVQTVKLLYSMFPFTLKKKDYFFFIIAAIFISLTFYITGSLSNLFEINIGSLRIGIETLNIIIKNTISCIFNNNENYTYHTMNGGTGSDININVTNNIIASTMNADGENTNMSAEDTNMWDNDPVNYNSAISQSNQIPTNSQSGEGTADTTKESDNQLKNEVKQKVLLTTDYITITDEYSQLSKLQFVGEKIELYKEYEGRELPQPELDLVKKEYEIMYDKYHKLSSFIDQESPGDVEGKAEQIKNRWIEKKIATERGKGKELTDEDIRMIKLEVKLEWSSLRQKMTRISNDLEYLKRAGKRKATNADPENSNSTGESSSKKRKSDADAGSSYSTGEPSNKKRKADTYVGSSYDTGESSNKKGKNKK